MGKKNKKESFIPHNIASIDPKAWGGGDYVYTLKCDYMDQSHKNNTPTAMFYDVML
jgi:hypothetical protein